MSSYDDILHWVKNYFATEYSTSPEFIGEVDTLSSFFFCDYVDRILLANAIESDFDITVRDDDLYDWTTIGDITKSIFKMEHNI